MAWHHLTDRQWGKIQLHIPRHPAAPKGGRPWANDRRCLEGILWILWTGAPWEALPRQYGSDTTCWRRLQLWERQGVFLKLWRNFLGQLNRRGRIQWEQCVADATFASAKRGVRTSGKRSGARAPR